MRKRKLLSSDSSEAEPINLTPLIDVVFVVLILFIIIAPMIELERVHLAEAPKRTQKEIMPVNDSLNMTIHVQEDNSILVNKKKVAIENLKPLLKTLHQKNPRIIPQLFQDKKAFFGTYQTVKNAVEEAGYEELDIILEPK